MLQFLFVLLAAVCFPSWYNQYLGLETRPAGAERSLRWIQFFFFLGLGWLCANFNLQGPLYLFVVAVLILGWAEWSARLIVKLVLGRMLSDIPVCSKLYHYLTDDPEDVYFTRCVPHPFVQFTGPRTAVEDGKGDFWYGFKNIRLSDVPKPPGVIRVACIGGSTTEDGYPEMLQKYFAKQNPDRKIQVLNFGRTWWSSVHTLVNFVLNVIDFKPDFVVVHDNCNDHHYRGFPGLRGDCSHAYRVFLRPGGSDEWLYRFSVIYRFLKFVLMWKYPKLFRPDIGLEQIGLQEGKSLHYDPKELQIFRRNLHTLCTVAAAQGAKVCFLTMPYSNVKKYSDKHDAIYRPHLRQANEIIRHVAQEKNAMLVDLDQSMTGKEEYYLDPVHVNPDGNRMKAEMVGAVVLRNLQASAS